MSTTSLSQLSKRAVWFLALQSSTVAARSKPPGRCPRERVRRSSDNIFFDHLPLELDYQFSCWRCLGQRTRHITTIALAVLQSKCFCAGAEWSEDLLLG